MSSHFPLPTQYVITICLSYSLAKEIGEASPHFFSLWEGLD